MTDQVGGLPLLALRSHQTRLSNYYAIATCAWLVYDHILTLPQEVCYMWMRPFSGMTLLFYINRYGALALRVLVLAQGTADNVALLETAADRICGALLHLTEALALLVQINVAVILSLRAYAIWGSRRTVGYLVFFAGLLPAIVVMYTYTKYIAISWEPVVPITGCTILTGMSPEDADIFGYATVAATIAFDILVLGLTLGKTISTCLVLARLGMRRSFSEMILRDGILYFVWLMVLNTVNIIQIRFAHQRTSRVLGDGLSAVFVSRFMLNLRAAAVDRDASLGSARDPSCSRISGIRFVSCTAEDFGGPVEFSADEDVDETGGATGSVHDHGADTHAPSDGRLSSVIHLAPQDNEA